MFTSSEKFLWRDWFLFSNLLWHSSLLFHTKELLLFCIIYTFIATRVQFFLSRCTLDVRNIEKKPFCIDICQAALFDTLPNVCTNVISFWILPLMEIRVWEERWEAEGRNQFSYFFYSVVFTARRKNMNFISFLKLKRFLVVMSFETIWFK